MPLQTGSVRQQLAAAAAKRIAEGEPDYRRALNKAANSFAPAHAGDWPSVEEIDVAVAGHQALFASPQRSKNLKALRLAARDLMRELANFGPRLYGPVATGTAISHSAIFLELAVSPRDSKVFEIELLNRGWPFEAVAGAASSKPNAAQNYRVTGKHQEALITLAGERFEAANRHWTLRLNEHQLSTLLAASEPANG
jgi:hypothetical protein